MIQGWKLEADPVNVRFLNGSEIHFIHVKRSSPQ